MDNIINTVFLVMKNLAYLVVEIFGSCVKAEDCLMP